MFCQSSKGRSSARTHPESQHRGDPPPERWLYWGLSTGWRHVTLRVVCAGLLIVMMGIAIPAQGAAFFQLERGTNSFSRGGANIASPTDPSGMILNPAALAGLRGLQLMVDANMVFDFRSFERAPDDRRTQVFVEPYDREKNHTIPIPSPGFFASYNFGKFGLPELSLGAAVFGPVPVYRKWSDTGPQRYNEISFDPLQIQYAFSAALELPWWNLRLGAMMMLVDQVIRARLKVATDPENPDADVDVSLKATDRAIPVGTFALSMRPIKWLVIGASYQTAYEAKAHGTADITLPPALQSQATIVGDSISLSLKMPSVTRVGIMYRDPNDRFDIETAFVWEGWSRLKNVTVIPKDIHTHVLLTDTSLPVDPIVVKYDFHDTYSIRLGGRAVVLPNRLTMRGGVFVEPKAVRANSLSVSSFDLDKVGFTTGGRVEIAYGLWMDLALGYVLWIPSTVKNSTTPLTSINVINPSAPPPQWSTANGIYGNHQFIMMLSLGWHWNT